MCFMKGKEEGRGNIRRGKDSLPVSVSFLCCSAPFPVPTNSSDGFHYCLFRDFNFIFIFCANREFPFTTNNWKMPSSCFSLRIFSGEVFPSELFQFPCQISDGFSCRIMRCCCVVADWGESWNITTISYTTRGWTETVSAKVLQMVNKSKWNSSEVNFAVSFNSLLFLIETLHRREFSYDVESPVDKFTNFVMTVTERSQPGFCLLTSNK